MPTLTAGDRDFLSLRDAFIELYKLSDYVDPDRTDLRILFSSRSRYANCEFHFEQEHFQMGDFSVSRKGQIQWFCEDTSVDDQTAEWLSNVLRLVGWILWEGFSSIYIKRLDPVIDRYVPHPHHEINKEDFVRVNLYSAFQEVFSKESPIADVAQIKNRKGELFQSQGMYLSRDIFNRLLERFKSSSKKSGRGAPKMDRNKTIEDLVLTRGTEKDLLSTERFLFFLEKRGIIVWAIKDDEKIHFWEGYKGPIFFNDEDKSLAWSSINNMRLDLLRRLKSAHKK